MVVILGQAVIITIMKGYRIFFLLLMGALILLVNGARPATAQNPADEILQLVNQYRAANGLHAYQYNSALAVAAQRHAIWMAQTSIYSHTASDGSTPQTRATAAGYAGYASENIVGGTNLTPRKGLIWWQNSALHNSGLLSTRYVDAGVGFASDGSQNFFVLVMGQPSGSGPAPANPPSGRQVARPLIITPIQLAEPRADGSIIHVIQPGQALWSLAAHYEVALVDLLLLNNLPANPILQTGQEIIIRLPEGVAPPPTPTPPLTHIVQRGHTLWTIAALNRIRLADLLWLNGLTEDSILHPGQELIIHLAEGQTPPPTPTPFTHHTVRTGQTLWNIALSYRLTLDELLAYNGITADKIIRPGDQLRIRPPDPTPTETPTVTPAPPTATATAVPIQVAAVTVAANTPTAVSPPTPTPALTVMAPVSTAVEEQADRDGVAAVSVLLIGLGAIISLAVFRSRRGYRL
jgi:LysM repeat protein